MLFRIFCFIYLSFSLSAASRIPKLYQNGLVVSDHEIASQVGIDILKKGGNAFDATIAVALSLSVLNPHSSGLGGGFVATFYQANKNKTLSLDAREFAPKNLNSHSFLNKQAKFDTQISQVTGKACLIPLELAGYIYLNKHYGKLPLSDLFLPAIKLAQDGFPLSEYLRNIILAQKDKPFIQRYLNKGHVPKVDSMIKSKELAKTLRALAKSPNDFYTGQLANKLIKTVRQHGGVWIKEDLENAHKHLRLLKPVSTNFKDFQVYSMPLPSSGGLTIAKILNILNDLPLLEYSHNSSTYIHYLSESFKFAFAKRASDLGDERFIKVNKNLFLDKNINQSDLKKIKKDTVLDFKDYGGNQLLSHDSGTTHFNIADQFGNVIAFTSTINTLFGSMIEESGIILNNQADDFSLDLNTPNAYGLLGSKANQVKAYKKPLSSMSPTIVMQNKQPILALGGSGGPRIISATLEVLLNKLIFNMTVNEAVDSPRFHHQWIPNLLMVEKEIAFDVIENLEKKGHLVQKSSARNVVQLLEISKEGFLGASDPRKMGLPAGY